MIDTSQYISDEDESPTTAITEESNNEDDTNDNITPNKSSVNVTGVEVNENSRFVDYTIATSWEQVIADIENFAKKIMKEDHNAFGNTYSQAPIASPVEIKYEGNFRLKIMSISMLNVRTKLVTFSRAESPKISRFLEQNTFHPFLVCNRQIRNSVHPA